MYLGKRVHRQALAQGLKSTGPDLTAEVEFEEMGLTAMLTSSSHLAIAVEHLTP
jgi:hypothetical protein